MQRLRIAVDTGGTFTDFVVLDESTGALDAFKVPSTRGSEADGIVGGLQAHLQRRGATGGDVAFFSHGTTVGTNALLEENGARTGLLVTRGFRGVFEVGEQSRPYGATTYDLFFKHPLPLVPGRLTQEVSERVLFDGSVLEPLDEAQALVAIRTLLRRGVTSIAVAFLFSFRFAEHERRVGELIAREAPDVNVSLSCDVAPQIREYYRMSTTVVNAYLNPKVEHYVEALDMRLSAQGCSERQRYIMRSNGGVATFSAAKQRSVQTILSGPAAGVVAASRLVAGTDYGNVVTFDMGGTSTDVALIRDGTPMRRNGGKVHGRDVQVPTLDIHTVAAGGGTVAWIDSTGVLQVGPRSAGAVPGPACYGKGGAEPTITDANLVLGLLAQGNGLAAGTLQLDAAAAERAIREKIAEPLGIPVIEAARGITAIINVKMEEAIKAVSSSRGYDLRDFALIAFGGAGPLHAAQLARELGMRGVIVPAFPGVTSALGLLLADVRQDYVASKLERIDRADAAAVRATFETLAERGRAELHAQGFAAADLRFEFTFDLRYVGQGYDLNVIVDGLPASAADLDRVRRQFDTDHVHLTGHAAPNEPVEIVNYRVTAVAAVPHASIASPFSTTGRIEGARVGERRTWLGGGDAVATALYDRTLLPPGATVDGPSILLQDDTTTVIGIDQRARVVERGQIEITSLPTRNPPHAAARELETA